MRYSSLVILVAASLASSLALAQTSPQTITFEGQVLDESCQATINGSAEALVKLDPVKESDFAQGKTAGLTTFKMEIKDCKNSADNKKVKVKFIAKNPVNGNLGNIAEPADAAENVSVQLTDDAGGTRPIELKDGTAVVQSNDKFSVMGDGIHEFGVQYYKDGDIKPGKVKAKVEYQLSYL